MIQEIRMKGTVIVYDKLRVYRSIINRNKPYFLRFYACMIFIIFCQYITKNEKHRYNIKCVIFRQRYYHNLYSSPIINIY